MNIAVSITALFSGIFIVVMGGLADKVGRVKMLASGLCLLASSARCWSGSPRRAQWAAPS